MKFKDKNTYNKKGQIIESPPLNNSDQTSKRNIWVWIIIMIILTIFIVAGIYIGFNKVDKIDFKSGTISKQKEVPIINSEENFIVDLSENPGDRIIITSESKEGVTGYYQGKKEKIDFSASSLGLEREATFSKNGVVLAKVYSGIQNLTYEIAGINWSAPHQGIVVLTQNQEKTLIEFTNSEIGRAIVEVAGYSYFKVSGEAEKHTLSFIQLYGGISGYYKPENKKLKQPLGTITESCFMKEICQLTTLYAAFGCSMDDETIDILPLLDGPPRGCIPER